MARRRYDTQLQTVTDINITPLMDLTFLLLIVFMITAPVLEYEVDVSPPQMEAEHIDEESSLMISLNVDGKIVFRKETFNAEGLTQRLAHLSATRPTVTALIRADGDRPYREVINVMKAVRAANISNVSLVTQPEDVE
ncbi:MAG: biopolymer transporter ExbD [Lentisphaerae bacterium]|jgi:biopolymer transport protein TolR|nr:biopolymer transporter ExbD [Lentisphaerota bacterium]MBT4820993.1 biopolymer transporter ExbD [Lentisphaerota bacterium]MBT5610254.1 biopolymer transporter ExbD [Lentisphaerota bacterium]MBT7055723.1 biopolymer transporter ExbD [Lentisphaerota bacterium]MBT7846018.1 biopolymer transporter ExbD [Lentisphaerota bacterium]